MNGCYEKLVEARSALNKVESSSLADFEFTDELVEEVIQAARRRLMGESSEETEHYLRELVHSVEVVSEDVTIRYAFNSTDTKVAYQLAPRAGFEPTTWRLTAARPTAETLGKKPYSQNR